MNNYKFAVQLVETGSSSGGHLLDIGCWRAVLTDYLPSYEYNDIDVDCSSAADLIVDIEGEDPFRDRHFELAASLEVLEHTDKMYRAVGGVRISRAVVIALPKLYTIEAQWRFLMGNPLSEKYGLNRENSEGGGLRHCWMCPPVRSDSFMLSIAKELSSMLETPRMMLQRWLRVTPFHPLLRWVLKTTSFLYVSSYKLQGSPHNDFSLRAS